MTFIVKHPEGYVLDSLYETDAKQLAVNVFSNTGGRCVLVNGETGEEYVWPVEDEQAIDEEPKKKSKKK